MRGKKVKELRTPERPNPGRKHGGELKEAYYYIGKLRARGMSDTEIALKLKEKINETTS